MKVSHSRTQLCQPWNWALGLTCILAPVLLVAACGCRAPWQHAPSGEPSFDRLLEIEQSQRSASDRDLSMHGSRPGKRSYAATKSQPVRKPLPAEENLELAAADDVTPPEAREMLSQTALALGARASTPPSSPTSASSTPASSRTAARGVIADSPAAGEQADEEAVVFNLNDRAPAATRGKLAADAEAPSSRLASSRRSDGDTTSDVAPASYVAAKREGAGPTADRRGLEEDAVDVANYSTSRDLPAEELTWEEHLREALKQLDAEASDATKSPSIQTRQSAISRMLSVALGDLEGAMEPITGLGNSEQDYFRHQFKALHDAIDPNGNPIASRRWSLTMISQRKALQHLAAVSDLQVNNAAFCTDVEGFGIVSRFPDYNFKPDQEVLLYCELDNFVSESVKSGFETQLQGRYEIVDATGRRVADQLLPMDSHICSNHRRDYFIAYRIYMPQNVKAGRHQLKLTIEDMKGQKFGHAELDFQIVD